MLKFSCIKNFSFKKPQLVLCEQLTLPSPSLSSFTVWGGFNEEPVAKFCILYIFLAPIITVFPILRNCGVWSLLAEITVETWKQAFIPKDRNKGLIPLSPFLHLFYCKWEMALIGAENNNSYSTNTYFSGSTRTCSGKFLGTLGMLRENYIGIPV